MSVKTDTQLKDRLKELALTQLGSSVKKNALSLNLDKTLFGFVFEAQPKVVVEVTESTKAGYIERIGYDGLNWTLRKGASKRRGSGPAAPTTTPYNFDGITDSKGKTVTDNGGGIYKVYYDVGTSGATTTKTVTIGAAPSTALNPVAKADEDDVLGTSDYWTPQQRAFALSFDFDAQNQQFSVSYQSGADGDLQAEDANATYVKRRESTMVGGVQNFGYFLPKVSKNTTTKTAAAEVKDETWGDGQVYLIFEVADFSDTSVPVYLTVTVQPKEVTSKVSSHYDFVYQVNAVDNGIGDPASPFEPAS